MSVAKKLKDSVVPYEQHPEPHDLKVLILGDSTALGTGTNDSRESTAGRLGSDYPNADIKNISENGLKLEGLLKIIYEIPKESHFDLIIIQIGANDITGFTPFQKIEAELDELLLWTNLSGTKTIILTSGNIGLAPVFRAPLSNIISARTNSVRELFKKKIALDESASYVDLFKNKEEDIFSKDPERYYASDKFHPSGYGYEIWYQEIKKYLDLK